MKYLLRQIFLLFSLLIIFSNLQSAIYETIADGKWSKSSTWSPSKPPLGWGATDTIIIKHKVIMDVVNTGSGFLFYGHLQINSGAELARTNNNFQLGDNSSLSNSGSFIVKKFTADWGTTTVINNGYFKVGSDFLAQGGTFDNYGTVEVAGNMDNSWTHEFFNHSGATLAVSKGLTTRDLLVNDGILTVTKDFVNDGGYTFSNSGTFICKNLTNGGDFTNTGTVTVSVQYYNDWSSSLDNSGTINITAKMYNYGDFTNSAGSILDVGSHFYGEGNIVNAGEIDVNGAFELAGNLSNSLSGTVEIGSYCTIEGNLTNNNLFDVGGSLTCNWGSNTLENNGVLNIGSDFNGEIKINNSGTFSVYDDFYGDGSVNNTGTFSVGDDFVNSSSLTNTSVLTIGGFYESEWSCNLNNSGTVTIASYVENYGVFTNSGAGSIDVGGYFYSKGNIENSGDLDVFGDFDCIDATMSNSGTLSIGDDWYSNQTVTNSGNISIVGNFDNQWGTVTNSGPLSIGGYAYSSGSFTNSSTLNIGGDFENYWGTINNSGAMAVGDDFVHRGSFSNSGSISIVDDFESYSSIINNGNLSSEDFLSEASITNNGTITITDDFTNKSNFSNYNYISVGDDMTCTNSSFIQNEGTMAVIDHLVNNGNITNNGSMEVDGLYSGSGNVGGTGDLCHSDGVSDPTLGATGVSCKICDGDGSTLPVELISFVAIENDGVVNLSWVTASEINNSHFEVLRSFDANNFEVIGLVDGHGTSNIIQHYSYNDNPSSTGVIYYRLRQVDFDGRFDFSEIISVSISQSANLSVFPNPAKTSDIITVNMSVEDNYEFSIYNLQGKEIQNGSFFGNNKQISAGDFAAGIYLIRVKDSSGHLNISKILIQE